MLHACDSRGMEGFVVTHACTHTHTHTVLHMCVPTCSVYTRVLVANVT